MEFLVKIISFLVVIGVIIFIHELGHFLVAKYCGVGVEKFSLGFGPKIFGFRRGETEYLISAVPFGGYVKMVGEAGNAEDEEDKDPTPPGKSFTNKSYWQKAAIICAGSFMNIMLAVVALPVIFMVGISMPSFVEKPPVVGYVSKDGTAFMKGVKKGDLIVEVNGVGVENWEAVERNTVLGGENPVDFKFKRDSEEFSVTFVQGNDKEPGLYPIMPAKIGDVMKGSAAESAGLLSGDVIKTINGNVVTHWLELQEYVQGAEEKNISIERNGVEFRVKLTPVFNEEAGRYLMGVTQGKDTIKKRYGFFESIERGLKKVIELAALFFVVIKGLIAGVFSIKMLGGPIMIAQVAGTAAATGMTEFVLLVAALSLHIGILNLLPLPVLDGGLIFLLTLEKFRGRPFSERFMNGVQQAGFVLLITLMVVVTWNDIMRLIGWG